MRVTIKTIPHKEQRYPTCGDWRFDAEGNLEIAVSEMDDWRYEMLVAFHELAEALMCRHRGISEQDVTAFDVAFEKNRGVLGEGEPGDQKDAPYHKEHVFAENLECMLAGQLDVEMPDYLAALYAL